MRLSVIMLLLAFASLLWAQDEHRVQDISPKLTTERQQMAPDGLGEYLPSPDEHAIPYIWGNRRVVGSHNGLLISETQGVWHVVPSLYGRDIRPIGTRDGLLWVEESGKGLLALDPEQLAIVKTLPEVQGRCIAVEQDTFWCLGDMRNSCSQEPSFQLPYALIEYDGSGKEKRRYPTPTPPPPLASRDIFVSSTDGPRIYFEWAAVDADAVWLRAIDFRGQGPCDSPIYGPCYWVRFDRATGMTTSVILAPGEYRNYLNLPDRILWTTSAVVGEKGFHVIHQLDKKTLAITTAGQVPIVDDKAYYVQTMATDGHYLWLYTPAPLVVFLDTLKPVPEGECTTRPGGVP